MSSKYIFSSNNDVHPELSKEPKYFTIKPSIGASAQSHGFVLKNIIYIALLPPITWALIILFMPLKEATSGVSLDNVPFLLYVTPCMFSSATVFHTLLVWFYPVTIMMTLVGAILNCISIMGVFLFFMAIDAFPAAIIQLSIPLGLWWPIHYVCYYYGLRKVGSIEKGKTGFLTLLKVLIVPLLYAIFLGLSMVFLLVFFASEAPSQQIAVTVAFSSICFYLKHGSMSLIGQLLPRHLMAGSRDEVEHRVRLILYSAYSFFDICQEVFLTLSLFEVADVTSAVVLVSLELVPMSVSVLKLSRWYFRFIKLRNKHGYVGMTLPTYRIIACELISLRFVCELVANVGAVILALSMRYGANEKFFPLRTSCHADFLFSVSVTCFLFGAISVLFWGAHCTCKYLYGIPLADFGARHLELNLWLLLSTTVTVYIFPAALLVHQMGILEFVHQESYDPPVRC